MHRCMVNLIFCRIASSLLVGLISVGCVSLRGKRPSATAGSENRASSAGGRPANGATIDQSTGQNVGQQTRQQRSSPGGFDQAKSPGLACVPWDMPLPVFINERNRSVNSSGQRSSKVVTSNSRSSNARSEMGKVRGNRFAPGTGVVISKILKECETRDGRPGILASTPWLAMGFPCTGGAG